MFTLRKWGIGEKTANKAVAILVTLAMTMGLLPVNALTPGVDGAAVYAAPMPPPSPGAQGQPSDGEGLQESAGEGLLPPDSEGLPMFYGEGLQEPVGAGRRATEESSFTGVAVSWRGHPAVGGGK